MAGTVIQTSPTPYCPDCGARMVLRRPSPDNDWDAFWGCSQYPECRGTREIGEDGKPESDEFTMEDSEWEERWN